MSNGLIGVERNDPELPGEWSEAWTTYRPSYDIKAGPPERVAEALNGFMAFLASRPSAEALEAAFDVQSFLRVLAVNAMVGMADDYWRGGNNYYLWQNPGGKWGFIPFDYDRSFGPPPSVLRRRIHPSSAGATLHDHGESPISEGHHGRTALRRRHRA
jgi:spore coat protein CotH